MTQLPRSWLYVPGDRPDRITKALSGAIQADAVIVDLEDSVRLADRPQARRNLVEAATAHHPADQTERPALWVRINSDDQGRLDLDVIFTQPLAIAGLILAKCETSAWLDLVAASTPAGLALCPLIESALAVRQLDELCQHPSVQRCHLGEIDLLADLGGSPGQAEVLIGPARVALVYAAAAARISAPIGGVHTDVDDLVALATSSAHWQQLGFGGRAVIHPIHCETVNRSFSFSNAETAWATDLLAQANDHRAGAFRATDRTMVDEAVLRRARRIVGQ